MRPWKARPGVVMPQCGFNCFVSCPSRGTHSFAYHVCCHCVSFCLRGVGPFFLFSEDQFPQTKDPPTTSLQLNLLLREIEILQELKFSFQRICMCFSVIMGKEI